MAVSKARAMRANPTTTPAEGAKILPFRRREPLGESLAGKVAKPEPSKARGMDIVKDIKVEEQRESKAKGGFRRSADLPSEHYVLAWLVWYVYVRVMLSSGLKVADYFRDTRNLHEPLKRAS